MSVYKNKSNTDNVLHVCFLNIGQSSSASATSSEAAKLRAAGVTIFSIGVGSGAKLSELNAMATDPDKTHVFTVTNFASLNTIKAGLAQKTCEGKIVIPC